MRRRKTWPNIPARIRAPGGWISVERRATIVSEGVDCLGLWQEDDRRILLLESLTPEHSWRILYHELAHMALSEGGAEDFLMDVLNEKAIEGICNAIASQRMAERFG